MAGIAITEEILRDVEDLMERHEPQTRDPNVRLHFMQALTAFMLAEREMTDGERDAYYKSLQEFGRHVMKDRLQQKAQQSEAFGIWRPESSEKPE